MEVKFYEIQKFSQWWLWIILLGISLVFIYGIYTQLILGVPLGQKPMSNAGLIILSATYLFFILFFYSLKLTTQIDQEGIKYKFFPFAKNQIKWNEIKKMEVLDYNFVGWGIRLSADYGTIYNIKGNKGLLIELNDGRKTLIGTQKPDELMNCIKNLKNSL